MRSSVYHRNPNMMPPVAKQGRQQFIIASEDVSNAPIVDLSCGAAVTGLGHSNLRVKDAMKAQISNLAYVHSAQFTALAIEEAADEILAHCPVIRNPGRVNAYRHSAFEQGGVTFFSGGAEAIEAAAKIALQYQAYHSDRPSQIVGRQYSYHGNTVFTLALGDHPRKATLNRAFNITPHVTRIAAFAPDLYGHYESPEDGDSMSAYTATCLSSLERELQDAKAHGLRCIVVIETVGGTTLAIAPPTAIYLMGVRRLCDVYDAVLIYDEILCANFRTGHMAAWQYYQTLAGMNVAPDIFVMGKGITAGYFPMSAVVVSKKIREVGENDGKVWHTSTNQNSVIGCAALTAAFQQYENLIPQIKDLSDFIDQEITPMLRQAPGIVAFTGVGLLRGVQFDPDVPGLHLQIKAELLRSGYSVYSDGGTVRGKGNMILFAPPYIMTPDQLRAAATAIVKAAAVSAKHYA